MPNYDLFKHKHYDLFKHKLESLKTLTPICVCGVRIGLCVSLFCYFLLFGMRQCLLGPVCPDFCLNKWIWIWITGVMWYRGSLKNIAGDLEGPSPEPQKPVTSAAQNFYKRLQAYAWSKLKVRVSDS